MIQVERRVLVKVFGVVPTRIQMKHVAFHMSRQIMTLLKKSVLTLACSFISVKTYSNISCTSNHLPIGGSNLYSAPFRVTYPSMNLPGAK